MKKVLFLKNALILTVTALLLRFVGIFFRVWLAAKIGAEGMGLYQVIFSVYVLASTFATSGICTAVTRMATERLAVRDKAGARRVLKISVVLSTLIAGITSALIIGFARPISLYLICDGRAEASLKILCLSLPFMGICSCIKGYFLARRSTVPSSVSQMTEQLVRILVIVLLIGKFAHLGLSAAAAAVLAGDAAGEAAGALFIYLLYKLDIKKVSGTAEQSMRRRGALREMLRIAVPISAGRYLHTALRTVENLITPTCFSRYTASKSTALEQFGMIKGMALPLLMFPASLLSSVSTLLVPEMTEAMAKNDIRAIRAAVDKVLYITALLSFLITGIFFTASGQIGKAVYGSGSVGYLIRALSPLIPFMYIDLIADGILKGLDQQNILLRNNVADSFVRIILVILLVPRFGMNGFLGVMLFSNLFTSILSVIRILRVTGVRFNASVYFFKPLVAVFAASAVTDYLCRPLRENCFLFIVAVACGVTALYFMLMTLFGGIKSEYLLKKSLCIWRKRSKKV